MTILTIHKEGRKFLFMMFILLVCINAGLQYWVKIGSSLQFFIVALSLSLLSFVAFFFRNPTRFTMVDNTLVVAPADGKVVVIEEVFEPEYFKENRIQVSIFMSPANVHVNRNPISGNVKYVKYHPGKYLVAWHPKSSTLNERNTVVIEGENQEIMIRQIAGALARRIVNYLDVGDSVIQGSELGFIKFGSRVDLFLPLTAEVKVELNQKVKGGEDIVSKLP